MVMLYSASMTGKGTHYLLVQLAACGLGLVACTMAAVLDYRHLKKISWLLLLVAAGLLVLVVMPGRSKEINGAHRWLDLRVVHFQPSELAKLAIIIALAHYGDRFQRKMPSLWYGLIIPGLILAPLLSLILLGKDYGTTVLLAAISGMLLLIAGVRFRFFVPLGLAVILGLGSAIWINPVRQKRVLAWLYPDDHKSGVGYQSDQAMIALGSGGWTGLGLGNGRQKLGFVPEKHTDFILSIIGEELGLVATLAVLAAFVVLMLCGVYISRRSRDTFGMLLGAGLTFLIGLQAAINIGVVTSVLPNKGLPLPFISYGGSNLFMMLASVGILISVARRGVGRMVEAPQPIETRQLSPQPMSQ
jgi:cell division protein FtsW